MKTRYVIISGNPVDGLTFYGPYETHDDALEGLNNEVFNDADYWIANLADLSSE